MFSHLRRSFFSSYTTSSLKPKTFFNPTNDNSLIKKLIRYQNYFEAIKILTLQRNLKQAIDILTTHLTNKPLSPSLYSSLLNLCIQSRALHEGKIVHAHIRKTGFEPGFLISNRLLQLYIKCDSVKLAEKLFDEMTVRDLCSCNILVSGYARNGLISEARMLFDQMEEKDSFSWTAMISGYVQCDQPNEALELFRKMQVIEGVLSNMFTVSSVLTAVAAVSCLRGGKEVHGHIIRIGLDSDAVVWSALSDMYGKCGSFNDAKIIFQKTFDKDVVSWTAMIDRCFADGRREEGFEMFVDLLKSGTRPNEFTFAGILNGCAGLAAEDLGKQVHAYMMRTGFDPLSFAASTLVHMYSKCGNIDKARAVFQGMPCPDLVSWTSLISGYAQSGQSDEALRLFELLLRSNTKPDEITFVGVLSACTHAGLVDKGLEYFKAIKGKHGLTNTADHYACVVDLLARSGRFKEAEDIIDEMPMKPDRFLWASLLGGCRIHRNLKLAERAAQALFDLEPENPATYVTLANIYATAGMWGEVSNIRKTMEARGVVKKPGMSWIDIKRENHVFLVGDTSHPNSNKIYDYLGELSKRMKEEGYVPDTNFVLHDVEEEQKEQNIAYHSEKLAVAFGIVSTPPGTPIKVYKNLRTCVDCHSAIKFISKIAERKIIVRDSNRFHCFENGVCSCKDFW